MSMLLNYKQTYNEYSDIVNLEAHWSLEINLKSPNKSICNLSSKNNRNFYYKTNIQTISCGRELKLSKNNFHHLY